MLDLIQVHLVKQTKCILAKVHRAARWVEESDVSGALERLNLAVFCESFVSNLLPGVGHQVICDRLIPIAFGSAAEAALSGRIDESGCICSHSRPRVLSTSAFTTHDGV